MGKGDIFEAIDRIFTVTNLVYDDKGWLIGIEADCLTPHDGDTGPHWCIKVEGNPPSILTVH